MSGIEDPGTPPELPQEYADIYRDAYLRALAEDPVEVQESVPLARADLAPTSTGAGVRLWLAVGLAALLLIGGAYVIGGWLADDGTDGTSPSGSGSLPSLSSDRSPVGGVVRTARPTRVPTGDRTAAELGPVWDGPVVPVAVVAAVASCTAPSGVDSANQPVTYDVENAVDDDPSTAWRCNGKARGQSITFTLPEGSEVVEVGLIPGYAKTDPSSGADRYAENNRITSVRWTLAEGVVIDQELEPDPNDRSLRSIRVPRTATGEITLQIRTVDSGARNTTAISSVVIGVVP